jgi:ABC-2 type transport system ATP-binding protein
MNEQTAIRMHDVTKRYSHYTLSGINLELAQGGIMGLIGPNGAGKSTTMRILMGLVTPDSGTVEMLGHAGPGDQTLARREVGFASEDIRLYGNATLQWHMDFVRHVFGAWDSAYAELLMKRFDLHRDLKIKAFSHGQKVKAQLLLCLARRPRLLLLDEPTTGLDPVARREVLNELMEVLADEQRSVLFSSHNTKDVEQLSDSITFIDRGRVIRSQDKESFLERWRRIRFEAPREPELLQLPEAVEVQRSGRLVSLVTGQFDAGMPQMLQRQGAVIHGVENMTLEEIFVAEVMASREGVAA